ncbi:YqzM family protein [Chryseomicrobium sp. FSL W7-1435]
MNEFENNVQSKRNDAIDSGIGFVASFVFFSTMFLVAVVVQYVAS